MKVTSFVLLSALAYPAAAAARVANTEEGEVRSSGTTEEVGRGLLCDAPLSLAVSSSNRTRTHRWTALVPHPHSRSPSIGRSPRPKKQQGGSLRRTSAGKLQANHDGGAALDKSEASVRCCSLGALNWAATCPLSLVTRHPSPLTLCDLPTRPAPWASAPYRSMLPSTGTFK
jgi:hypothetical protein